MFARVVTSFAHGSFFGIGAVVAASLVPAEKRASAIALMFTGLTLANVLGVPFGTFIGQEFGWRATFWIVAALGVLSALGVTALVPNRHDAGPCNLGRELRVLKEPQVWLALAMTVLGFGGVFVVFTYIAPILEQVGGFSPHGVTLVLVLFGVGLTIGNTIGGKLADRALMPSLMGILVALAIIMAVFATHQPQPDRRLSRSSLGHRRFRDRAAAANACGREGETRAESCLDAQYRRVQRRQCGWRVARRRGADHGYALDSLPWVAAAVAILAFAVTWYASRLDARPTVTSAKPADA